MAAWASRAPAWRAGLPLPPPPRPRGGRNAPRKGGGGGGWAEYFLWGALVPTNVSELPWWAQVPTLRTPLVDGGMNANPYELSAMVGMNAHPTGSQPRSTGRDGSLHHSLQLPA